MSGPDAAWDRLFDAATEAPARTPYQYDGIGPARGVTPTCGAPADARNPLRVAWDYGWEAGLPRERSTAVDDRTGQVLVEQVTRYDARGLAVQWQSPGFDGQPRMVDLDYDARGRLVR